MLTDWELWACANHYVNMHGEDAPIIVAMKIDELMERGELDGAANFEAIMKRIEKLLAPPTGAVH